jgi:thiosulfate/3-mercaptopyruvate sulfurtransferase
MRKITTLALSFAWIASAAVNADLLVSTSWLADHLKDPNLVVLHVAAARSGYDANHIPGARFLNLADITVTRDGIANEMPDVATLKAAFERVGVSNNTHVVVYAEGSVLPATRAFFTLEYLGHTKLSLLNGGIDQWTKEARALTQAVPTIASATFTPHPRPELIVSTADVEKQSTTPTASTTLLDVRARADYADRGHIPTALNANWTDSQQAGTTMLKSETELRAQLQTAGLAPGKTVVTYCNSGMQATQSYFTLRYLGIDTKLYDGSMGEWNKVGGTVVK